ncbi:PQQ-binding-like beta-propeller repeat protein [Aeoliella sp.]|uniref:outer membrane protein assembly factor BamB family protein n=1 Tax=Aeoliella sp. TaxID=2795800 RepID=UPI003CCC4386
MIARSHLSGHRKVRLHRRPPLIPLFTLHAPARLLITRWAIAALVTWGLSAWQPNCSAQPGLPPGAEQAPEEASDLHSLYYSAHLPTDRRLAQDLDQARQLFESGRYSEGLPLVDRVLEAKEDTFELAHRRESSKVATSLKSAAKQLLASLPADGVAALELDQGVRAQRELSTARQLGSLAQIAHVAQRYPVTEAAGEAMLLLAQAEMDAGRYALAASLYEELQTWPKAAAKYEALLAVRLVVCHAASGNQASYEEASARLTNLQSPTLRAEVAQLTGNSNLKQWLTRLSQAIVALQRSQDDAWLVEGRDPARNPVYTAGGAPHVWPTWDARTVKEFHVAQRLEARLKWQHRRGVSWGLVASPIAVGNYVIVRTPSNLVAVDFNTGRRVWETRGESVAEDTGTFNLPIGGEGDQGVALEALEQRLWVDSVYGALSSDGDRVYAIRNLESIKLRSNMRFRLQLLRRNGNDYEEPGNTLTAYDLRTEGKRLWEINGESNEELSGCFFLGAPIAVGDTLCVLAEFANSIHLLQLDSETGRLLWKQPLANLERSVVFDIGRRLAGATPSYAGGLVLCPTGAGSVVAVDPVKRSLEWAFRFEVDEDLATRTTSGWQQQFGAYQPTLATRWQRNRVIANGDSLLVTAPECNQLYCLDTQTGEKRWAIERGDYDYLAGITRNHAIAVAGDYISLIDLKTGKTNSDSRIDLPSDLTVAGLGVLTEDALMLPLSGNQVGVVNLASGKFERVLALREGESVGNLVYHRGALVSQSATSLTRFDQMTLLREQLAQNEQNGVSNANTLRIQGELAWGDGDLDEAIRLLLEAYQMDSEDSLVKMRLTMALVTGLRKDYPRYREHSDLLASLSTDTRQRLQLYRFNVEGSLASSDPEVAYEYAREIYLIDPEAMLDRADGHRVQSERWFAARLNQIWNLADEPLRKTIADDVDRWLEEAQTDHSTSDLARLVRYFGGIPAGRAASLQLADEYVVAQRFAEAELLLLQSAEDSPDVSMSEIHAQVAALVPGLESSDALEQHYQSRSTWPDGKVETAVETGRVPSTATRTINRSIRSRNYGRLLVEPRSCGLPTNGPVTLALSYGNQNQLFAWNQFGEVTHGIQMQFVALQNSNTNSELNCVRFGHFAVLGAGDQVAVVDLRQGELEEGPLLWSSPASSRSNRRTLRAVQIGGRTVIRSVPTKGDSEGPTGEFCSGTPRGVVLRNEDQLCCYGTVDGELLWERRDMPTDGAAFGDSEFLFLKADGEATGVVLSMIDGSTQGEWQNPEGKTILTHGRSVVVTQLRAGRRLVRMVDVLDGTVLAERSYSGSATQPVVSDNLVVVMEPTGELEAVDATTGKVQFAVKLEAERQLETIHLLPSDDTLFVATNTRSSAQHNTSGNQALDSAPIITGHVYALDAATGEPRWSRPASVRGQGLWRMQPTASPALVFISRQETRQGGNQGGNTRLLVLDKRTGRSLIREDELRDPDTAPWTMLIDHAAEPTVSIDLRHTLVTLRFTDAPRPPEPVALADVEGVTKGPGGGLFGILRKWSGGSLSPEPPIDDDD